MIDGAAGEKQFSDAKVRDPMTVALRQKVNTIVDPAIKPEQVDMTITLKDGRSCINSSSTRSAAPKCR